MPQSRNPRDTEPFCRRMFGVSIGLRATFGQWSGEGWAMAGQCSCDGLRQRLAPIYAVGV
eukprot:2878411-Lingulodinium_polyedra.AAC.1